MLGVDQKQQVAIIHSEIEWYLGPRLSSGNSLSIGSTSTSRNTVTSQITVFVLLCTQKIF